MEYVMLEVCEKYGISPMEFEKLPHEMKVLMLAKRELDREARERASKKDSKEKG